MLRSERMVRTTIFLSEELHQRLKQDAFQAKVTMAELIRAKLTESKPKRKSRSKIKDPILKVAGIFSGPAFSRNIDEDLYGL